MRIALLDPPNFTPPYDHSLASALARRGHDVHLLTSPLLHGRAPEPDGYRRHDVFLPLSGRLLRRAPRARARVLVKGAEYVPSVRWALRRLQALAADVVHVQWLGIPRYDVRWLRAVVGRHPTVLTAHDVLPRRSWNARAWGEALGLVDRVVVHSERAVDELSDVGVARRRLAYIPHAVFSPNGHEPGDPRGRTLVFFGLLRAYKGIDVLLRALPTIVREVPDARLVIAGDPLEPVRPLRELAEALGVADRIEWRLGFLPEEEVRDLFASAAFVVLPYRRLDSSGVLATALGYGRPAVVSDVGSLGVIVREFGAGKTVPPDDPPALAVACSELLADETALARAASGARAARETLTWDGAAAAHERLYETIVAERG
ncbi:MAG: glycosyltransferase [Actinomycetota bacterium]|nr:glycosyltransferase [Actinomycetota bacterium]